MINDNMQRKKNKYQALIQKMTFKYTMQIAELENIIETIENNAIINENDSLETIVFKKYLELENADKVSKYINDLGYRIKTNSRLGERKYISSDISDIITGNPDIDPELKAVVQKLQEYNFTAVSKIWW